MEKEKIDSLEELFSLDQKSTDKYACYRCFTMQPLDDFPQGYEYEDKCKVESQYANWRRICRSCWQEVKKELQNIAGQDV